jgi:hypothetical protein
MSLALPGTRGLFSVLQEALRHQSSHGKRLRHRHPVHDFLDDFQWLVKEVSSRPTSIDEISAQPPVTYGAIDASGKGMGGFYFYPEGDLTCGERPSNPKLLLNWSLRKTPPAPSASATSS